MKSWNEIRKAATAFSKRWKNAYDEKAQAQSFLKEFVAVFGVDTVVFNAFEHRVKFTDGSQGYADCFWQGKILVEMKSAGKDLDTAYQQAMEYVRTLPPADYPHAVVVSDFQRFRFYNLERDNALTEFALKDLRKYVTLFGYMIGADEGGEIREQDPVNRKAAEKMARLHDAMKAVGYTGHPLEVYLVRLLFCLFAEDTGIFKPNQFCAFIEQATADDGHDLAPQLAFLFQTLNAEKRLANLDESLGAFPYVNGGLFAETLPIAAFSPEMRRAILDCGSLDWSKISPAIFGAMFQGVMDVKARHDLGAHYTSEENILKLIRPLFLDALRAEFNAITGRVLTQRHRGTEAQRNENAESLCLCVKNNTATGRGRRIALEKFHEKIAALTFLDPACGCGNFLLIAYRELRRLEMDVLEELHRDDPGQFLDISQLCKVSVSQFYGIEIEPFAAEIAKVALWLMDHLCNMEVADRFGQYFARIPIKDSPHIVCANALTMDWGSLLCNSTFSYIFGNPPFLGVRSPGMTSEKKAEMLALFPKNKNLDYVCGWYKKARELIQGTSTRCAFVSTNSITQGEQVAPLWKNLNVEIDFACQTFKWHNEAKNNAAVHCVIIGFHAKENNGRVERAKRVEGGRLSTATENAAREDTRPPETSTRSTWLKTIYAPDGTAIAAPHINGYLMPTPDVYFDNRPTPINPDEAFRMRLGNVPYDYGFLTIEEADYADFIAREPGAIPFIRLFMGGKEFINRLVRYCLWLKGASPAALRALPHVAERVEKCRLARLASKDPAIRKLAATPTLFREANNPDTAIIVPRVSSENRDYIPIGFIGKDVIVSDLIYFIPGGNIYQFGVLNSRIHNLFARAVGGRLEMRIRYSQSMVYNNFVWPRPDDATRAKIAALAQEILDIRKRFLDADPKCTLADLYDRKFMPPDLVKAHAHLDALVDKAYGLSPSCTDADRVAHLFKLYAEKTEK